MAKTKCYVVSAIDWRYNDEYYYRDSEGSVPVKAFMKREAAELACEKKELEAWKTLNSVGDYIQESDISSITSLSKPELVSILSQLRCHFSQPDYPLDCEFRTDMTDDEWKIIMTVCDNLRFYEITELELDEQD